MRDSLFDIGRITDVDIGHHSSSDFKAEHNFLCIDVGCYTDNIGPGLQYIQLHEIESLHWAS